MKFNPTLCVLACLLAGALGISAQKTRPTKPIIILGSPASPPTVSGPKLSPEAQRRQDAFMQVWSTLNFRYFDKTFSGLDWQKIREEFQPRVTAAKTDAELHTLIEEMVGRLGRSHFGLIPPDYFEKMKAAKTASRTREKQLAKGHANDLPASVGEDPEEDEFSFDEAKSRYGIGVNLKLLDNKLVVASVDPISSAAIEGVKPGYIVDKINGVDVSELMAKIQFSFPNIAKIKQYIPIQITSWLLNGPRDTSVFITCLDESDKPKEFKIGRILLPGQEVSFGETFPTQFLDYQSRSLNADVGYIKFNVFSYQVIDKFCRSLSEFADKKALIIDLRGNLGGVIATIYGLAGMLTDHEMSLGTTLYREANAPFTIPSKVKNFKGNVILLVDSQTMSSSEFMSAGLRDNSRVIVVGDRTGGQALMAISMRLPTGAVLEYPIANFRTPKGKYLEGIGVEPDYTVSLDRKELLKGIDSQLEKALDLIKQNIRPAKPEITAVLSGQGSGIGGEAPPPPPKAGPSLQRITKLGTSSAPPPPTKPNKKDDKAVKLLSDFATALGGEEKIKGLKSYEISGTGRFRAFGTESGVRFQAFRQAPNRFSMVYFSDALGEIRQVYNEKGGIVQSEYGLETDLPPTMSSDKAHLLAVITELLEPDYFTSLAYDGVFDAEGKSLHVVEGRTAKGTDIGLTFDTKTGMLVRYTLPGLMYTFEDYKKAGDLVLPYTLKIDGIMDIKMDSIKINEKIDPANLEKRERCFDKPL